MTVWFVKVHAVIFIQHDYKHDYFQSGIPRQSCKFINWSLPVLYLCSSASQDIHVHSLLPKNVLSHKHYQPTLLVSLCCFLPPLLRNNKQLQVVSRITAPGSKCSCQPLCGSNTLLDKSSEATCCWKNKVT